MRKGYEQTMRLPSGEETCAESLVSLARPSKNHAQNTLGPGVQRRNKPDRRRENQRGEWNSESDSLAFSMGALSC